MTKYCMIILVAVVIGFSSGCDNGLTAMEDDAAARPGSSVTTLSINDAAKKESDAQDELTRRQGTVVVGVVEDVGKSRIQVRGIDYFVNANTVIENREGNTLVLSDIAIGAMVRIQARLKQSGIWRAIHVVVGEDPTIRDDASLGPGKVANTAYAFGYVEGMESWPDRKPVTATAEFSVREAAGKPGQTGEGKFFYKNSAGEWYEADVQQVHVDAGGGATFCGPVIASNPTFLVQVWMYVRISDGGKNDSFMYQIAGPPEDDAASVLPDEHGVEVQITSGDITVTSASAFDVARRK